MYTDYIIYTYNAYVVHIIYIIKTITDFKLKAVML